MDNTVRGLTEISDLEIEMVGDREWVLKGCLQNMNEVNQGMGPRE